jgi:hypothetical protein
MPHQLIIPQEVGKGKRKRNTTKQIQPFRQSYNIIIIHMCIHHKQKWENNLFDQVNVAWRG